MVRGAPQPGDALSQWVPEFIAGARAILRDEPPREGELQLLQERMRELLSLPALLEEHEAFVARSQSEAGDYALYADTGRRSEILHSDESGLTLVRSRFSPTEATPVHSHSTWGIVGVYAGQDLHRSYRRRDEGTGPGYADLELIEERVLVAGDVVTIPPPPHDIHSQQGYGGQPTYELVLFGANAMVIPRLVFDIERRSARTVIPGIAG